MAALVLVQATRVVKPTAKTESASKARLIAAQSIPISRLFQRVNKVTHVDARWNNRLSSSRRPLEKASAVASP